MTRTRELPCCCVSVFRPGSLVWDYYSEPVGNGVQLQCQTKSPDKSHHSQSLVHLCPKAVLLLVSCPWWPRRGKNHRLRVWTQIMKRKSHRALSQAWLAVIDIAVSRDELRISSMLFFFFFFFFFFLHRIASGKYLNDRIAISHSIEYYNLPL